MSERAAVEADARTHRDYHPTLIAQLKSGFVRRYVSALASTPTEKALGLALPSVALWLTSSAPLQGVSAPDLCERLLDAFFASESAGEKRYPVAFLAYDPGQYLAPAQVWRDPKRQPMTAAKRTALDLARSERVETLAGLAKCADDSERYSLECRLADLASRIPRLEAAE